MAQACHPSTEKAEAGMSKIQGEPEPYSDERERLDCDCEGLGF